MRIACTIVFSYPRRVIRNLEMHIDKIDGVSLVKKRLAPITIIKKVPPCLYISCGVRKSSRQLKHKIAGHQEDRGIVTAKKGGKQEVKRQRRGAENPIREICTSCLAIGPISQFQRQM